MTIEVHIEQTMLAQLWMVERAGKPGFVAQMIERFMQGSAEQIASMLAASDAGDAEKLRVLSHTLKSNAGSFGAVDLSVLCKDIEADARAGIATLDPDRKERLSALHAATCTALRRKIGQASGS